MTKSYTRRTSEERIAELEAKILDVKTRAAAKEAKERPEAKPLIAAVKALDKTVEAANQNPELLRVLESVRATLGEQLVTLGLRLPKLRKRAPRRSKGNTLKVSHEPQE